MNFNDAFEKVANVTTTENGDVCYNSSLSKCLDLFALGSSCRNLDVEKQKNLVLTSFLEDEILTLKILFYIRDIREGSGERDFFRNAISWIYEKNSEIVKRNIKYIPEFGRWDDIFIFLNKEKDEVISIIKNQLDIDLKNMEEDKDISLLGKWLKSENTSSKKSISIAKEIRRSLGYTPRQYRKILSKLRKHIGIIETKISEKRYVDIDYSKIPSRASKQYVKAFYRNDKERIEEFLDKANKGEVNMNTANIYPYEIYEGVFAYNNIPEDFYNTAWKNLPNYINEKNKNALVVADVSGSMEGRPMSVSISTALYFAERCSGEFSNKFITFSKKPKFHLIQGDTLIDKLINIQRADWDMDTNLVSVFELILNTAKECNVKQSEMPKILYIISDMEFNGCVSVKKSSYERIKNLYIENGYEIPTVVFWNVDARNITLPVMKDEYNTVLISGFSMNNFKFAVENLSPLEYMLSVINSERYVVIE